MNENQQEWEISSIGEYCITSSGGTPNRSDPLAYGGDIPWVKSGEVASTDIWETEEHITPHGLNSSSAKIAEEGSILVAMYGATAGQVARLKISAATNQAILAIRPKSGALDSDFLYHFIHRSKDALLTTCQGSGQPNLSAGIIRDLEIAVPPLPEQKKIAEILSGIDHSLAKLSDKINALTRLRVQLTRQFLTNEDHLQSNQESILPLDWQVKTLDELAQFRRGSFPQPYGNPEWFDDNGFPFVQVFDIDDNGKLKSSTKSRISKAGAEKSVFIPCGSLIVSLQGSIGRVAITQYDAYVDRTILIFTDYQKDLDRAYFSLLIGDLFSRQGEVADGGVIKTITKQTLKDFSIKIPPLNEQKRMSKVVFALDRHISLYKKKLLKGNFLKQSLMGDLLSGRKRVSI